MAGSVHVEGEWGVVGQGTYFGDLFEELTHRCEYAVAKKRKRKAIKPQVLYCDDYKESVVVNEQHDQSSVM